MTQVIPKSKSRKVNGYVKAVLALEAVRRKREDRYDRSVRPLDRKRDGLAAEVAARLKALSGGQQAEARRILGTVPGGMMKEGAVPDCDQMRQHLSGGQGCGQRRLRLRAR